MKTSMHPSRWIMLIISLCVFTLANVPGAKAQQFGFGQNRVQYHNFQWRFIKSKHFNVYYYTSQNYDLANFAAVSLEASLKQLQQDFGHQINDRIDIIVYDSHNDFAETNVVRLPVSAEGIGGVTDPFKNRVTLPFMGSFDEFRSTLQHELVHAVINDMFYGGNVQSRLSGNALQIPLWFNEGMAEYESKGWDTQTDMYMRDANINDYLPPISRLGGFFAYRGGESVWNYIVEEYGRNKITEIFQNLMNLRNLDAAFQRSIGMNVEELSKKWESYYKKRYLPEVARREDVDEIGELVTKKTKEAYNTSPAYSPQGDKIALLTNARGYFDLVVLNAITGEKIKTLIKGNESVNFESLHVLNPNITWSPDGTKIALSAQAEGKDQLAIVDYNTEKKQYIKFPNVDAVGAVAWSPDGKKIAFDGNIGPFQDIFVYNIESEKLTNLTNDVISDSDPAWGADSQTLYFTSARGNNLQLNQMRNNTNLLMNNYMYNTDIYSVKIGQYRARRLTQTPLWNEYQPETTRDGRLVFISDENGIPNIYQLNLSDRTTNPLTNLQTGAQQISISGDGGRLAMASLNEGYIDIFSITAPFNRLKNKNLKDNQWAKRRANEPVGKRVPAISYVKNIAGGKQFVSTKAKTEPVLPGQNPNKASGMPQPDSTRADTATTTENSDSTQTQDNSNIDFRNYVFEQNVEQDTAFANKYLGEDVFDVEDNTTDDGRYIPKDYRLKFSTDIVAASGGLDTYYGANGILQVQFSDLLGDHQLSIGSDLQFDLRNSSYFVQYANLKHRVNWLYSVSHTSYYYQTYSNASQRYRYFIGGVTAQYPLNRFQRIDFTMAGVSISQDYSVLGTPQVDNQHSAFLYPQVTFTNDKTLPGYITPAGGFRYAVELSASPPITDRTLQFASLQGDFRKYFNLGSRYSFAFRGSGGASLGRDSQTYFLGGMQGWINRQYSNATIPRQQIGRSFIAQPAIPLRGYGYFAISGDKYALANAEFRFPIFAAILPGPIPILPLYNLTGVAFVDAGMAWGQDINYDAYQTSYLSQSNNSSQTYFTNDASLNLKIRSNDRYTQGNQDLPAPDGDILIGAGFGLRTIVFGLPLRYDIGWPYYRDGFHGNPINYITIGIDF